MYFVDYKSHSMPLFVNSGILPVHAWKCLPQIRPRKCPQFQVSLPENSAQLREFRILGTTKAQPFLLLAKAWIRKWFLSANNRRQCTSSFVLIYNVAYLAIFFLLFSPPKRRHFKGQQKKLQDLAPLTNLNRNLLRCLMEEK